MRKKFTMLLTALFLVMGTAWAKTVTEVTPGRWYQLCCQATDNVHASGVNVWLSDDGSAFYGKSSTPTFFEFMAASVGKYYLYSHTSKKYVNVNGTSIEHGETAVTEWTVGTIDANGYVYISPSDKNYLNNAGGTNNVQIKNHPSGVSAGNPCSLWTLHETTPLNSEVAELGDLSNGVVYGLQCERAPLKGGSDRLTHSFTAQSGLISGNVGDVAEQFAILRTAKTPEGKYYLYSLAKKKFVQGGNTYSDAPVAALSFEKNSSYSNSAYPWKVKLGDVLLNVNGSGIVLNNDATPDQGNQFKIVGVYAMDFTDVLTSIESAENDIYRVTNTGNRTRSDRKINSISLASNLSASNAANTTTLTHNGNGLAYIDMTKTVTMKAYAGETVTAAVSLVDGGWIHAYAYIDLNSDGFTAGVVADGYTPTGDLMTYSFYSQSGDPGKNSAGTEISGNDRNTLMMPSFYAPATPGTYRMRFKTDWNNFQPEGSSSFMSDGGTIVDVTLVVEEVPAVSYTVKYEFVYNGEVKYVQENSEQYAGNKYPEITDTHPYGVVSASKPDGEIDGNEAVGGVITKQIALSVRLPFEVSENYQNATWYALQIRGNKYVSKSGEGVSVSTTTPATEDALWAFMGNPFDGIKVLNKAAREGYVLANDNGIKMTQSDFTWNIYKGNGGFMLREGTTGNNYIHNLSNGEGLGYWNNNATTTDQGSAFVVTSEAEMISLATAALNTVNTRVSKNEAAAAQITDASYYAYSKTAVTEAKTQLDAVADPSTLLEALQVKATAETALNTLEATVKTPKVGDYIRFKNRAYPVYLATTDNADNVIRKSDNANDLKTIWLIEEGSNGSVLLKNVGTEKYVGNIAQSADVKQVEKNDAAQLTFSNLANDVYGRFQKTGGGDYSFANMNEWYGSYQLKGWLANEGNTGSHWLMTQAYPLTVVYNFKGDDLAEQGISTFVDAGASYTITNPYANKYVNVTCAVNGNRVEPVDGQWTVNVAGPTSVIVTITEDLPFKPSKDFATANWQYLQIHSGAWEYVRNDGEAPYTNTTDATQLNDGAQWAFVGDALNGFKILNRAAADGYTLSYDGEVANETLAYMKQEEKTWIIEKGNGGFVIRQGANECLNDFNDELKFWKADASPNNDGSAFRVVTVGVTDLKDLCFPGIFTLQAERSPLLYDASANVADANKLSSGMASGIAANGNDANQQFLISESETDGLYYLYSVGAARFVDANLNFTDYPQPVLSFEANKGNAIFPWFVKIGGKYVVPSNGGTAGNKIIHTENPEADAGKWYRIEKIDEDMSLAYSVAQVIQAADGLIKDASDMFNDKVYRVYTHDRGKWYYREGEEALWSTGKDQESKPDEKDAEAVEKAEKADKFAFLAVNGKTYLYSVGAGKFIVKSEAQHGGMYYAAYSDTPAQTVELLAATNGGWFPVVVKLNAPSAPSQLAISNSYDYPVVMYDDLSDTGNQVRIEEIGTLDLSAVVAQIEAYQMDEEAKGGLQTLITEASTKNTYLENASLTDAITAAQAALDKVGATYDELMTAKENLATALNSALYVTEINGFSNNYVYTFVSKRGWMGADNTDGVISGTGADDNTNYQWAVYKSTRGHYYLYNIGKTQFMGVETRNNTQMPFSATPQATGLTFKKSSSVDYPIMFSMDNQYVVNNNDRGQMICWTGGWDRLDDEGSNHKITAVGKINSGTLATIAAAVEAYETQGVAVQALEKAIAAAQAKVNGIGAAPGYYSTTNANAATELAAIVEFKNVITGETTVAAIEAQTAAANALVETFSVNLPEVGKYYRFGYDFGGAEGVKYVQAVASNVSGKANAMVMTADQGNASIFYYDGGEDAGSTADDKLLSSFTGRYVKETGNTRGLQTADASSGGAAKFEAGSVAGKLYIFAGDSFHAHKDGDTRFVDHCGSGHPDKGAGDEHNFIVEEVNPEFCDIVYVFKCEGVTIDKYTQRVSLLAGAPYPALQVPALPYGVSTTAAKPDGTVSGSQTFEFTLTVDKALPFKAVAEGEPTTWYYAQMHANADYTAYVGDDNGLTWWNNKNVATEDTEKYLWGFVGDLWSGYKMVNKATGRAIHSTGSGDASLSSEGTAFIASNSDKGGDWFCLKYPDNAYYLNANAGAGHHKIEHWDDNDAGSSILLTECKTYTLNIDAENVYSTYYSDVNLLIPTSVEVYIATELASNYVALEQVKGVLPAHTGVLLKNAGAHTHNFVTSAAEPATVTTEGTNISENHFKGTTTKTLINAENNTTYYVLAKGSKGVGLYTAKLNYKNGTKIEEEGEVGNQFYNNANKVYLPVETPGQAAPALVMRFGRGQGTTEIELPTANGQQPTAVYDLQGRRVLNPTKGMYIINGKKVVIR